MHFTELFVSLKTDDKIVVETSCENRISGSEDHDLQSGWNKFYMLSQFLNSKQCSNGKGGWE